MFNLFKQVLKARESSSDRAKALEHCSLQKEEFRQQVTYSSTSQPIHPLTLLDGRQSNWLRRSKHCLGIFRVSEAISRQSTMTFRKYTTTSRLRNKPNWYSTLLLQRRFVPQALQITNTDAMCRQTKLLSEKDKTIRSLTQANTALTSQLNAEVRHNKPGVTSLTMLCDSHKKCRSARKINCALARTFTCSSATARCTLIR